MSPNNFQNSIFLCQNHGTTDSLAGSGMGRTHCSERSGLGAASWHVGSEHPSEEPSLSTSRTQVLHWEALSSLVKTGLIMALERQGKQSLRWKRHAAVTGLWGHTTYAVAVGKAAPGCACDLETWEAGRHLDSHFHALRSLEAEDFLPREWEYGKKEDYLWK